MSRIARLAALGALVLAFYAAPARAGVVAIENDAYSLDGGRPVTGAWEIAEKLARWPHADHCVIFWESYAPHSPYALAPEVIGQPAPVYTGKDLEMVTEVRYHPSGVVFMHVITNGGNAVIGRVLFDTDSDGRVLIERHFLWGWLVKTVRRAWCPHGVLLSVEEQVPGWTERVRDPFFVEHKPSAP